MEAGAVSSGSVFSVLVIGAAGNFGARLVRLLVAEPGIAVVLGGRRRGPMEALAATLAPPVRIAVIDRAHLDAGTLRDLAVHAVVDASGPFQAMSVAVPAAAIAAGVHAIDLADSREYVAAVAGLDEAARAAGVAVLAGASSTPALSHAAIDALCAGWTRIDTLRVTISPSNRQPRGRAVVDAILAGVGQPHPVWRDGREERGFGWGGTRRVVFPGIGQRWASWCDTPDTALLRERYRPRVTAEFLASLELSVMHLPLVAIGWAVRRGWIATALPLAGTLQWMADRLQRFGSDWGGMVAEAKGLNAQGQPEIALWRLRAEGDAGPNVPVLAAAAIRKLRDGTLGYVGAGPCVGVLTLADFDGDLDDLGIETGVERVRPGTPLFRVALGDAFERLPAETRGVHSPGPVLMLDGQADVEGASNVAGRALARMFGFPAAARAVPLRVTIEADETGERWRRVYPTGTMESRMTAADPAGPSVEERFGNRRFRLGLDARADGIDMRLTGAWIGHVPLPRFAWPRIAARERAEAGRHVFDVEVGVPVIGRLVGYRGWLRVRRGKRFRPRSLRWGRACKPSWSSTVVACCAAERCSG